MQSTAATRARTIVVIEDEEAIGDVIAWNLEREGFTVHRAVTGSDGLQLVKDQSPRLVVLDLMLPELDGIEVCRAIRSDPLLTATPVIMLTAKGDESDIVLGLGVGADDYVTKPFSPKELVARVQAVLRRNPGTSPAPQELAEDVEVAQDPERRRVEHAGIVVDPDRHEVLVDGEPVHLTRTELRLLHVLVRRPGRVYTRDQLVTRVMGDNAWVTDRTIDVHVRAIRRKLDARADVVETIRGVGYRARDERG